MGIGTVVRVVGNIAKNALDTDHSNSDKTNIVDTVKSLFKKNSPSKSDSMPDSTEGNMADPSGYKKGGTVKKSGMAKVHKGEKVLTKRQSKKYAARKGPRKRV